MEKKRIHKILIRILRRSVDLGHPPAPPFFVDDIKVLQFIIGPRPAVSPGVTKLHELEYRQTSPLRDNSRYAQSYYIFHYTLRTGIADNATRLGYQSKRHSTWAVSRHVPGRMMGRNSFANYGDLLYK